jgi:hypothetical protein
MSIIFLSNHLGFASIHQSSCLGVRVSIFKSDKVGEQQIVLHKKRGNGGTSTENWARMGFHHNHPIPNPLSKRIPSLALLSIVDIIGRDNAWISAVGSPRRLQGSSRNHHGIEFICIGGYRDAQSLSVNYWDMKLRLEGVKL